MTRRLYWRQADYTSKFRYLKWCRVRYMSDFWIFKRWQVAARVRWRSGWVSPSPRVYYMWLRRAFFGGLLCGALSRAFPLWGQMQSVGRKKEIYIPAQATAVFFHQRNIQRRKKNRKTKKRYFFWWYADSRWGGRMALYCLFLISKKTPKCHRKRLNVNIVILAGRPEST